MKFSLKALAAAAMLSMPVAAQAQIDNSVAMSILSHPFATKGTNYLGNGSGGGFKANFAIDFPAGTRTFNDFLVWCIDANRTVKVPGGPYTYTAYTALDFANNTAFGGSNNYNVSQTDMQKIVTLTDELTDNWYSYGTTAREDRQGSIWALFRGEATVPSLNPIGLGNLDNWVVLYNGENQTFLTYVPEPSSALLLFTVMGSLAFMVIARRRRA